MTSGQGFPGSTERARLRLDRPSRTRVPVWTMTSNRASQGAMRGLGSAEAGTTDRAGLPHPVSRMDADASARTATP